MSKHKKCSPLVPSPMPYSCGWLGDVVEAIEHKKQRNKKSEFSGSYKIISASHLLEAKIRG